jgi:hypothetical protein
MAAYYQLPNPNGAGWFGNAGNIVQLANQLVSDAEMYISDLANTEIFAPTITPNFPVLSAAPAPVTAPLPELEEITWSVPPQPAAFNGSLDIGSMLPPPFSGVAPSLNFGSPPAPFTQQAPASPALDLNFTYPTVAVDLPTPPSLLTLDTVPFPNFQIPTFDATVPALTAQAPNTFQFIEPTPFTSSLLTQLETDLQNALSEGNFTGLPPDIENALWDRGREREYRQMADALADIERMETMGFAFPPGVYIDARIKMQTEMQNTTAGLSREVMIKQAELILTNIVKARENATQLESKLIDYANDMAQRAFETAKYATEAAISIYNAQVQAYTASLEGYKTQALVYDAQIKGLLAQVDVVKAQIEFEQVKAEINTALVNQYKAEVEAAEVVLEIYKTEVEIIKVQASVEQIKVSIFGEQIKAFVGQVNAYTAQVEGYKAQVETQGVIESVFKTQVDAYAAEVNAGVAEANALIAVYRGQIEAYTAQIEGFKAAVAAMVGQAQAASLFNTAEADVYRSQSTALASYNQVLTAQWQAVINEQEKIAEVGVSAAKANGDLYIAARGLSLDASKVGAQVTAQLGAAALGAIHWANNASWSIGSQISGTDNNSISTSTSTVTETVESA